MTPEEVLKIVQAEAQRYSNLINELDERDRTTGKDYKVDKTIYSHRAFALQECAKLIQEKMNA